MIPILFPAGTTDFTTNGLGRLADATDCIVTEERNGAYELTLTYPVTGIHFADITHSRIIYAQPADGKANQPFEIYFIGKPLNGITEIRAQHISYRLSFIPVSPFSANDVTGALAGLKNYAAETCPFSFSTDKSTLANFRVDTPSSIRSLLGGQQGSILDVYGGEWEFDMYSVKLHGDRGEDRKITLRYGKNITDIRQEESIANTYTGVMPYWKGMPAAEESGESTEESTASETIVMLTEKVLHHESAANYPFQRTIPLDLSSKFESQPTEEQLRTAARSYMNSNGIGVPSISINVSFVPLWQTEEYKDIASLERVNLCDTVSVEFVKLRISAKAKVVKTEYDVLKERYKSIEIGDARSNFVQAVNNDVQEKTEQLAIGFESLMKAEIDRATKLLKNPGESHVMFYRSDAEEGMVLGNGTLKNPEGILIMDKTDPKKAKDVLIINKSGIGFSHSGVNGDYEYSWTLDGRFTTEFISTWELLVNMIRLYGLMEVHKFVDPDEEDEKGVKDAVGGYIGFGEGYTGATKTHGIMLSNTADTDGINRRYLIATNEGVRITAGDNAFYLLDNAVEGQATTQGAVLKLLHDVAIAIGGTIKVGNSLTGLQDGQTATYTMGGGTITACKGIVVGGTNGITQAQWDALNTRVNNIAAGGGGGGSGGGVAIAVFG